jgi:hypothetical protein
MRLHDGTRASGHIGVRQQEAGDRADGRRQGLKNARRAKKVDRIFELDSAGQVEVVTIETCLQETART